LGRHVHTGLGEALGSESLARLGTLDSSPASAPIVDGIAQGEVSQNQVSVEIRCHGGIEAVEGSDEHGLLMARQRGIGPERWEPGSRGLAQDAGSRLPLGVSFSDGWMVFEGEGHRLG